MMDQEVHLLFCLNPLSNDPDTEATRHRNNGSDDGDIIGVCRDIAHKGTVDLECINRVSLQIT